MAENKTGQNLQAGAGIFAKRVQKSLNRAQEKVSERNAVSQCDQFAELAGRRTSARAVSQL